MKRLRAAGERLLLSLPDRQRDDELEDLDVLDANPFMLREATVELEFDNSRTVEFDYEPEFARYVSGGTHEPDTRETLASNGICC
jgi:hypothetical protein